MTKVTEASLAELKESILASQKSTDQRLMAIEQGFNNFRTDLKMELTKLEGKIDRLEEKTDAIDKRLGKVEEKTVAIEISLGKLEKTVDGVSTRLGILETRSTQQITWFLALITAVFTGLLAIVTELTFFQNNA